MLKVLYEDNHLIAVHKPAGMLVQGDETGDRCLMDEIKDYLKEKYQKPGNVFLGMLHRLDRPVSGVILFAKTSKGAARLSEQFRDHETQKIYHALVVNPPERKRGILINYLKKDGNKNKVTVYDEPAKGADYAELAYETVSGHKSQKQEENHHAYALLKITLKTGRSHQIRSQLAHIGCPIVGDLKYGAIHPLSDKSIALCATSLSFKLPTQEKMMTVTTEIPEEWKKLTVNRSSPSPSA